MMPINSSAVRRPGPGRHTCSLTFGLQFRPSALQELGVLLPKNGTAIALGNSFLYISILLLDWARQSEHRSWTVESDAGRNSTIGFTAST
eukprot:2815782-Rhodomonas_salina.3